MAKILKWTLFTVFCLALLDQGLQWFELSDGWLQDKRVAPYDPPLFNNAQRTSLLQIETAVDEVERSSSVGRFDAELGWAPAPGGADAWGRYDAAGAREDGSPPAPGRVRGGPGPRRVVAAGCSYTFGVGVEPAQAWPARVEALRPDLEVVNLGVVGYGLDQSLLRLWRDGMPLHPDEVWLGWRPGATLRVTTVYPPALAHQLASVSFKPRYVMDGETPRLVPNPAASPSDVMRLLSDQRAFMDAVGGVDTWVRRRPEAWQPFGSHWSHRFAMARLVLTAFELEDREPERWLVDRHSEASRLVRELVMDAARRCQAEGVRFRLLVLPDQRDLEIRNRTKTLGYWADTVVLLRNRGVEVLDLSDAVLGAGALSQSGLWSDKHYGPTLSDAVAGWLAGHATDAPPPPPPDPPAGGAPTEQAPAPAAQAPATPAATR